MSKEAYATALKNALTEIRNVCPDVQTSFLFDKDAVLITGDSETPEAASGRVAKSLESVLNQAETLGGFESIVIEGSKGNIHVSRVSDMYLAIVTSKDADMRYVETVGRVLIPTVIQLLDRLGPTPLRQLPPSHSLFESDVKEDVKISDKREEEENEPYGETDADKTETNEPDENEPPSKFELPSNQLIVESFGGLLVRSDTVQISGEIMSQWQDQLEATKIETVEIESFNGKTSQCKVKALNGSKLENKAVIRIPEKLCQTLDIKKGELVRVKPLAS
jgi:predicted regulator of Ras-like GTPase activity (Roadblock/LC7/MglB family)